MRAERPTRRACIDGAWNVVLDDYPICRASRLSCISLPYSYKTIFFLDKFTAFSVDIFETGEVPLK
jgi:hypothetical protein